VTIDGNAFRTTAGCDDFGAFEVRGLRVGATAITARAPGFASREATKVDLVLGASIEGVKVVVDRTFSIRGRIVDRSQPPQGIEGASIRFSSMVNQRSFTSDSDGRFQIDGLPPGEHTLKATKPGTVFEDTTVAIRDADVEAEITQRAVETTAGNVSAPQVFQRLEFGAARERALAERKLLLVDATAEWCGPCKMMDRTTWVDKDVVAWVRDHAIALQIDVDAEKAFAQEFRITAMPTIIAFVDDTEFDRGRGEEAKGAARVVGRGDERRDVAGDSAATG
jgi:thiol-disulfide isomerase/thioredoxin